MKRHDTPEAIARELASHAPRRLRTILDPAAGSGILLAPLTDQLIAQQSQVFCVDSDKYAIKQLESRLRPALTTQLTVLNNDFLCWARTHENRRFDCIVMNPPFAATKRRLCRLDTVTRFSESLPVNRFVPLEVAFLCQAIALLADSGRLLAVLPGSLVMSQDLNWFRRILFSVGAIRHVHELPGRSFPGVESRMYLFVFDKGARQRKLLLSNHDLKDPERLKIPIRAKELPTRLDFGFHRASESLRSLMASDGITWRPFGHDVDIMRGDIESPDGPASAVHTSDFHNGFWRSSSRHDAEMARSDERIIRSGDILVKRVGRNSHLSFGKPLGLTGMPCSDCVFILRPKRRSESLRLLFALKSLFELSWAATLIQRGTGASYITESALKHVMVPSSLHEQFPGTFASFRTAHRVKSPRLVVRAIRRSASYLRSMLTVANLDCP